MKRILTTFVMACVALSAAAQSVTSYYMPDAIERRNLNVALAPERGYFSIPLVGAVDFSINGNLSLSSIIYQNGNELVTLLDSSVSSAQALENLSERSNFTGFDNRISILSFGKYRKDHKSFWSFDMSMRTNANFSMPYEFFEFVKQGKAGSMGDISLYMESFMDISVGISRQVNDKLTVGGRVKVLVGLMSASLDISKFDVKLDADEWAVDAAGELDIYGPGLSNGGASAGSDFDFDNIEMNGFSPAGYGVAVDLGAEYKVLDNLKVSLAANDVGFISWSQKSNVSATMSAYQSFSGVEVSGTGEVNDEGVDFSFDDMTFVNAEAKATTRFLQANILAAAEYTLFNELIGVGAMYQMNFWRSKTMHSLVGMAHIRPVSWFTFATSYNFVNNSGHALGLAVNLSPSWFNLFIASDVLLSKKSAQYIPINQSTMNVSLGLAFPIGKRSLRSKYTKYTEEDKVYKHTL